MKKIYYLFLISLLFSCSKNPGNTTEEKIDYVVNKAYEKGGLLGSVLVANQGKIIYKKSFGMADAIDKIVINDSTKFLIASLSKPFTAILILQLKEQGKIQLEDEISKYFKNTDNPKADKVTIHQLLTHTSGIKELINEDHEFNERDLAQAGFNFDPGSDFEYSNSGYVILKEIAEISSGKDYVDLIESQIFSPAEMHSSGVARDLLLIDNLATGYKDTEQTQLAEINYPMEIIDGIGSLYATTLDLYKLDKALYSEKLLSKASIELMLHQHVKEKFGYGWYLRERGGIWDVSYHKGNLPGYTSFFSRRTTKDQAVILLANVEDLDLSDIENDISRILKNDN